MLSNAGHEVDSAALSEIKKLCHHCQLHDQAPRRFKFSIKDETHFNYDIIIDVVHLGERNALHVIDSDTSFQAAVFLKSLSAKEAWDALCRCWINVYQGPPDFVTHDPGTNFASEEFRNRARIVGVTCREMPIEAHWAIGKIERAHPPLKRAYDILRSELDEKTNDEDVLQMAVKALNDTAGPDGLVPTLLVFGAYPRINMDSPPSPDMIARATAIRKAMKMLRSDRDKSNLNRALNTRNGPSSTDVLELPLDSEVLVWREKDSWQGPYRIKGIEGRDIVLDFGNGPAKFRWTHVKAYNRGTATDQEDHEVVQPSREPPIKRKRGRPRKDAAAPFTLKEIAREVISVHFQQLFLTQKETTDYDLSLKLRQQGIINTPGAPFEESDRTEIEALIANGIFEIQRYNSQVHNQRIFNLRLVREIKGKTTQPYEKSRLVLAGHNDTEKDTVLTQSPTIQRMSQRLILAIGVSLMATYGMKMELRDITQAYIQSTDKLARQLFAKPPKELKSSFPPDTIFQVVRPLYGAAESGLYWYKTYHNHHTGKLRMKTSTYDPCLLMTDEPAQTFGITGLQTDDTLSVVSEAFSLREEDELKKAKLRAKAKTTLTEDTPIEFNGGKISLVKGNVVLTQKGQSKDLRTINLKAKDAVQKYVEQRARGAYIASVCQPEASFDLSVAAQTIEPTPENIKSLNNRIQWQIDNSERGLTFVPLNLSTLKLFIFTDGSFANNKDLSSQIGFIIVLGTERLARDGNTFEVKGNIVHWNSVKCKRVTRSVLASELYGMVGGFDNAIAISTTLRRIMISLDMPPPPVILCTDSKSLYDCLVRLGTTAEKRLMIDIMSLRESYEQREISEVRWINGKDNPADACTKSSPNRALESLVSHNKLMIKFEASVDRLTPDTGAE
jgi:hypothetical protein